MKSSVFVIEDHPLMRRSLVEAIEREPDLTVCGQAEDAQEAFAAVVSLKPDMVLTDIQLKSSSGLDLIKALREHSPALPVVANDVRRPPKRTACPRRWSFGFRLQTRWTGEVNRNDSRSSADREETGCKDFNKFRANS